MAAFSRLQLAAALLEYDNDLDNPGGPFRSAQDSAIFSHLRPSNRTRRSSGFDTTSRHSTDYLGVALPSEVGSGSGENPRRSRASIDALQNPFGTEIADEEEEPEVEEELEVDLASWGLDTFLPKEKASKGSKGAKGKARSFTTPNPHPTSPVEIDQLSGPRRPPSQHIRPASMAEFGAGEAFLDSSGSVVPPASFRRNSIANPLDVASMVELERPLQRRRASSHVLIETLPIKPPLHSIPSFGREGRDTIPFPSSTPPPENGTDTGSRPPSRLDAKSLGHARTVSNATMGTMASKAILSEEPNPFALRPPSPTRASRFDPKVATHARTMSNATALSTGSRQVLNDENRHGTGIPSRPPSRSSRLDLDVKSSRARHLSNASIGTRNMLDNDMQSVMTGDGQYDRERRYSRMELMRPKVLIMPSPLQSSEPPRQKGRDGFHLSSDGPPIPLGARPSRPSSILQPSMSLNVPVASNSFTPNPRLSLSPSQLIFRNSLMVGGQRDVTYSDIDGNLGRAQEEGEQVQPEWPEEQPPPSTAPEVMVVPVEEEEVNTSKPPGKLFGKSLIDDLEARKAQMRSKQRVFSGDQRPSMMDRTQLQRSSTLIDPASLQPRQVSQHMDSFASQKSLQAQNSLNRRGSRNSKPLLNFNEGGDSAIGGVDSGLPRVKSVFGVDTLWEREMVKLKEIEANEKIEAEEQRKREEDEEAKKMMKKKKKKKRGKGKDKAPAESLIPQEEPEPARRQSSTLPPVLPDIPKTTVQRKKMDVPQADGESDDDSSSSDIQGPTAGSIAQISSAQGWVSDEDEDGGPLRTTGVGPRYPKRSLTAKPVTGQEESDEDLPLSATLHRVVHKLSTPVKADDSEDEDKPLSTLLDRSMFGVPPINFDQLDTAPKLIPRHAQTDEDDDEPLGIRASRIPSSSRSFNMPQQGGDDDDRPLAMHPEQQRRTQYQMMAQQQMLFQAQMRNTMAFGAPPSMMGSVFNPFGPPMQPPMAPMMMPPSPAFSPQPQDAGKYGVVDRWRRDVVVEGQP